MCLLRLHYYCFRTVDISNSQGIAVRQSFHQGLGTGRKNWFSILLQILHLLMALSWTLAYTKLLPMWTRRGRRSRKPMPQLTHGCSPSEKLTFLQLWREVLHEFLNSSFKEVLGSTSVPADQMACNLWFQF